MAFHDWGKELSNRLQAEWMMLAALSIVAAATVFAGLPLWQVALGWFFLAGVVLAGGRDRPRPPVAETARQPRERDLLGEVPSTLDALDVPALVLDREANILFQNDASSRTFGSLPTGAHISARLRSPAVLDMIRETLATGRPNQIEHAERLPSQQVYLVRIAPVDLPAEGQGKRLFLLAFRDISELRRLDRMRSDFVANASHELRTPLASLRGFIETLQGPAKSDPKAQERFLSIMLDQSTRMSRLLDDLLSLSRLELRANVAPEGKVDLVSLLSHVRDSLSPLAGDLGVSINLYLPPGPVEVAGERDELVQVFENLVENACKYGQEGKAVDVFLSAAEAGPLEVTVADYGPGIPSEHLPRLTERFYRVSVEDSRSKKGTGLGLAIVKHILTRHRARLIVASEVGKGSRFTVRF
ncbi:phosphate regulon sensor histidine kinase PhoR [Pseudorhizobium endolithicum]|uniref:Phosphate regulon sensor protein PhoR n=1 Tax=Pseudorhizobium endolithicum TaxID=1191678 RepID=A0ABM8PWP3_9HYPH|nr:phosphate regulon sensor histidine kinase PhoR [Pseudorhizobium endolithicum]CAD7052445.1 phosphate regulon sensor histidine kinase PhoR [Pseudorhizobium endolithicum]